MLAKCCQFLPIDVKQFLNYIDSSFSKDEVVRILECEDRLEWAIGCIFDDFKQNTDKVKRWLLINKGKNTPESVVKEPAKQQSQQPQSQQSLQQSPEPPFVSLDDPYALHKYFYSVGQHDLGDCSKMVSLNVMDCIALINSNCDQDAFVKAFHCQKSMEWIIGRMYFDFKHNINTAVNWCSLQSKLNQFKRPITEPAKPVLASEIASFTELFNHDQCVEKKEEVVKVEDRIPPGFKKEELPVRYIDRNGRPTNIFITNC